MSEPAGKLKPETYYWSPRMHKRRKPTVFTFSFYESIDSGASWEKKTFVGTRAEIDQRHPWYQKFEEGIERTCEWLSAQRKMMKARGIEI